MSDERYTLNTIGNGGAGNKINLVSGQTTFSFLQSGDLFEITHGEAMINQIRGNLVDGSMNNIYLRIYDAEGHVNSVAPMLGVDSDSSFSCCKEANQVKWVGNNGEVKYEITFTLADNGIWFWNVEVEAGDNQVDILYAQDVGLAHRGMIQANEAYTSQYVDYKVFDHETNGYVVCSRQNQPQNNKFPYLQQGSLTKAVSYSTDGYQFFGLSYKETDLAEALFGEELANKVYQYEFGYVALLSVMKTGSVSETFYGIARDNHETAITELEFLADIEKAWNQVEPAADFAAVEEVKCADRINFPLETNAMTIDEIDALYPERIGEEYESGNLLSFFTPTYEHVVLKEKELQVERSHGHILLSGDHLTVNEEIITTTSYMYGVFNAQVVVGNTTMNKLMSNTRNGLNVMKTSGQRIYVDTGVGYQLLTMPSMFEMGFNYARWYYKIEDDTLIITNFTAIQGSDVTLHVRSASGKAYRFIVTNQITMNEKEYEVPFRMVVDGQTLTFKPTRDGFVSNYYPELTYHLHVDGAKMNITDETALLDGAEVASSSLVVLELDETVEFTVAMQGKINGGELEHAKRDFDVEVVAYRNHFKKTMNGFNLSQNGDVTSELEKLNITAWWYTHNMFVHYLVPHGIEQYGGAAWGTRDVCQGPFEYFLAMGHHDVMRSILLTVFSHQFEDDGNWPQWFMFDKYVNIQAGESHGDIIAWPLYVIATYLKVTGDYSILDEAIPYMDRQTFNFTSHTATLFDHVKKEIAYIKANFLHDTYLSCYGDGDWDDTLQPHDQKLKKYMASSWTVALT
jgi:cellobiose phosphorylase